MALVLQVCSRPVWTIRFYMYLEKHRAASLFIYLGHALLFFLVGLAAGWA